MELQLADSRVVYQFDSQLSASKQFDVIEYVESVLRKNIVGIQSMESADLGDDRAGADYWIRMTAGNRLAVDTKVRSEDWLPRGQDDLALETWSDIDAGTIGWTLDPSKKTDYVLWVWKDTRRWCMIPYAPLRTIFVRNAGEWRKEYKVSVQTSRLAGRSWRSECIFVPRRTIWAEIYNLYGGAPCAS